MNKFQKISEQFAIKEDAVKRQSAYKELKKDTTAHLQVATPQRRALLGHQQSQRLVSVLGSRSLNNAKYSVA